MEQHGNHRARSSPYPSRQFKHLVAGRSIGEAQAPPGPAEAGRGFFRSDGASCCPLTAALRRCPRPPIFAPAHRTYRDRQ